MRLSFSWGWAILLFVLSFAMDHNRALGLSRTELFMLALLAGVGIEVGLTKLRASRGRA